MTPEKAWEIVVNERVLRVRFLKITSFTKGVKFLRSDTHTDTVYTQINPVFSLQRKVVKAISWSNFNSPSETSFQA